MSTYRTTGKVSHPLWETHYIHESHYAELQDFYRHVMAAGADGWELVCVLGGGPNYREAWFKRLV